MSRQLDANIFREARCFEPISYASGRKVAEPGDRLQVEVGPTTWFVYAINGDILELIYTTQSQDWMLEHVIL